MKKIIRGLLFGFCNAIVWYTIVDLLKASPDVAFMSGLMCGLIGLGIDIKTDKNLEIVEK